MRYVRDTPALGCVFVFFCFKKKIIPFMHWSIENGYKNKFDQYRHSVVSKGIYKCYAP